MYVYGYYDCEAVQAIIVKKMSELPGSEGITQKSEGNKPAKQTSRKNR